MMNKDEHTDAAFTQEVRAALDVQTAGIDAQTLTQLRRARARAMASLQPTGLRAWARGRTWSALAVTATVVLTVSIWPTTPPPRAIPHAMEDIELLAVDENIEFYEDLEFYTWLADEDATVADPDPAPRV
ncbi:MAG: hypothetical protein OEW08_07270 [Gammaproteobacteria bacterium]|nr:hypothetical protein [Gammaproteobacteria bacterium]